MRSWKHIGLIWLGLLLAFCAKAQTITGSLRGKVVEQGTAVVVASVTIQVISSKGTKKEGTTNEQGVFEFTDLEVGTHTLRVSSMTHYDAVVNEVWIRSGKQTVLEVEVEPRIFELQQGVEIVSRPTLEPLGVRSFSVEQSLRYAATFLDPARLVTIYPGVVPVNDQANHISVRGNSPNASKWMIEGLEIVNPSHTGNAGTPSDRPTLSGGGVNAFSTQMLRRSSLLTGVYDTRYSNASGSLMNMNLRKGNDQRKEWTLGAGLIGIDVAHEGPISKKKGSSYLINYRYSTLGVLSALGVDLGDEEIVFQDIAGNIELPISPKSYVKLFGMGGWSSNDFEGPRDSSLWVVDKDSLDINYRSTLGVGGAKWSWLVNESVSVELASVYSDVFQSRRQSSIDLALQGARAQENIQLENSKWSSRLKVNAKHSNRWRAEYGVTGTRHVVAIRQSLIAQRRSSWLIRPYLEEVIRLRENSKLTLGVAYASWQLSNSGVLEPRIKFNQVFANKSEFSVGLGRVAQIPTLQLFADEEAGFNNAQSAPLELATSANAAYKTTIGGLTFTTEAYVQFVEDQGTSRLVEGAAENTAFDLSNGWEEFVNAPLRFEVATRNMGLELTVQKTFRKGSYFNINAAFNNAEFVSGLATEGRDPQVRWDRPWSGNASVGKEFFKSKEGLDRVVGVTGRLFVAAGNRYDPIDPRTGSGSSFFDAQYSVFHRLDLRIYWKKYRGARTSVWALDIQNAANADNGVFDRFDQRTGSVITETQLGIIPNLSYRIEF